MLYKFIKIFSFLLSIFFIIFTYSLINKSYDFLIKGEKINILIHAPFNTVVFLILHTFWWDVNSFRSYIESPKNSVKKSNNLIDKIYLDLDNNTLEVLLSDIKKYKKEYLNGKILINNKWENIKIRLKSGNPQWHSKKNKPSLKIKLNKNLSYLNDRELHLVNPKDRNMIQGIFSDLLAKKLNIMSANSKMVELYINNQFRGVYHMNNVSENSFLIDNKRTSGEFIQSQGRTRGDLEKLINFTRLIEKTFYFCQMKYIHYAPWNNIISRFSDCYNKNKNSIDKNDFKINSKKSLEIQKMLWDMFFRDKIINWDALNIITSNSHFHGWHNRSFFKDDSIGKYEPVVDDPSAFGVGILKDPKRRLFDLILNKNRLEDLKSYELPLNEPLVPILDLALRDPYYVHERNLMIYKLLNNELNANSLKQKYADLVKIIEPSIKWDLHKTSLEKWFGYLIEAVPYSNSQFEKEKQLNIDWIDKRSKYLLGIISHNKTDIYIKEYDQLVKILFSIDGNSGIKFINKFKSLKAYNLNNKDKIDVNQDQDLYLLPGLKKASNINFSFGEYLVRHPYHLHNGYQQYLFSIKKNEINDFLEFIKNNMHNAITDKKIIPNVYTLDASQKLNISYDKNSIHPWIIANNVPSKNVIEYGPGDIYLNNDLIIKKNEKLIINPDTTFYLNDKINIIINGEVIFNNKNNKMIRFLPMKKNINWGSFVVNNQNDVKLQNCIFEGGSLKKVENIKYSGMVSIFWSNNVEINNCEFNSNKLSDDTLHILQSNISLKDLNFRNCNNDCLDLDFVNGEIYNINFFNSNNDALDLMTSNIKAKNINIQNSQDKGISVGEKSKINLHNIYVKNSNIGIEVKDNSYVNITNSKLEKNSIALNLYKKKIEYDGEEEVFLNNINFFENVLDIMASESGIVYIENINYNLKKEGNGKFIYN